MTAANIIHFVASRPAVNSTVVAKEFGRRHDNVLRKLDSLVADDTITHLDFELSEYTDSSGRKNKCYELFEDGFLIAMPFIGGKKARQGQRRLVIRIEREARGNGPGPRAQEPATSAA